jgi:hypothetical protein
LTRAEMKANREGTGKGLMARMEVHPELRARMERRLDWAENSEGEVFRAAEAEERAIREVKALRQEGLQDRAKRLVEAASKQAAEVGRTRSKKTTLLARQSWRSRGGGSALSRPARPVLAAVSRGSADSLPCLFAAVATLPGGFCVRGPL